MIPEPEPSASGVTSEAGVTRSMAMSVSANQESNGAATTPNQWDWRGMRKSSLDCKIAGVCGGFGEHTPLPSWMWRVLFLTALFCGGVGLVAYIILWISMPAAEGAP